MDRNKHCRPSTLVSRLQDKLRVRSLARESSPSMRRIWFDERSKCCRFRRWSSPWILVMRLQWALSVCRSELRDTSLRLRRGAHGQPAARPYAAAVSPRPVHTHLLTPLSMRLSSPGIPAWPPGPRTDRISLQSPLVSHGSAARLRPGQNASNASRPRLTAPPRSAPAASRSRRGQARPRGGGAAGARGAVGTGPCLAALPAAPLPVPACPCRFLPWAQEGAGFTDRTALHSFRGDAGAGGFGVF